MPTDPPIPRYRWRLVRAGFIRLDGGGMFGVIPRAVWSRFLPPDDLNRIRLAHNCLLLERDGQPAESYVATVFPPPPVFPGEGRGGGTNKKELSIRKDPLPSSPGVPGEGKEGGGAGHAITLGGQRILIETGTGNKFGPRMRRIFALDEYWLLDALAAADCSPDSVSHVIVSHLHFDHAGGLTRAARPGERPDWIRPADGSDDAPRVVRTFPSAGIIVQRREWEDAIANRSVMTRTYLPDHLEPIRGQLQLVDSPPPFPAGHLPSRNELPPVPLSARQTEVLPGIRVFLLPGHTWGQQAIAFTDERGRSIVFTPDVLPTIHHIGPAYSLAYDVEPYVSMCTRRWFLEEAVVNNWLLVLDHEPDHPLQRVRRDGKGWYVFAAEEE